MATFGIDVSTWQGNFDFAAAKKEGVKFAILRAGYGKSKDTRFDGFYNSCKQNKIPVGAYIYGVDSSPQQAIQTAKAHINNALKYRQFEYPIYYDVEDKVMTALPKNLLTDVIIAFCETLEDAGFYAGIYGNTSLFKTRVDDSRLIGFTHWVAAWNKTRPELPSGALVHLWQFGGEVNNQRSNKVAGTVCDQDYSYVDFPSIMIKAGLNGFKKEGK